MERIPYGRQSIDKSDINAVSGVLRSSWMTQGPKVSEFEEALARYCGARYAVAVSSGTAALHLACLAAGLKEGDEAVTTPVTFLATPNSVFYAGAKPVFADIDYETVNISPAEIKKRITRKTKAVLPVHFAGLPCNMKEISAIAKKNKLTVIEDACHALGAEYSSGGKWIKVGSCRHSDMAVFSFHPVKTIALGEGGAITTNSRKIYEKLLALRSHGTYKDKKTAAEGSWYYEMRDFGFNYRLTDIQCSLGISQLGKIDRFLGRRKRIASAYNKAFGEMGELIRVPEVESSEKKHAWHLYLLRLNLKKLSSSRKKVFDSLRRKGIDVQVHYIPVSRQPFYRKKGYGKEKYISSEKYYKETISLPIYPGLKDQQLKYVIKTVKDVLEKAAK